MEKVQLLQEILRILSPVPKLTLSQLNMSDNESAMKTLLSDACDSETALTSQSTSASEQSTAGSNSIRNSQTA